MRTYELHASVKQISRSAGRSSVGAAAYRSATRLVDERTGIIHDFRPKGGVEYSEIHLPDNAPEWAKNRAALWNSVEKKENRSNSTVAHELQMGFPAEFDTEQRREMGTIVSKWLLSRYKNAVDIAYHQPSKEGDQRNAHAHISFPTRAFDENNKDGWARTKFRDLSHDKITIDGKQTTRGKQEILLLREFVANEMNRIAERDGLEVKTEHLSFETRGIDKEPTQHLGPTANQMEREGKNSERGNINREIKASNDNRDALKAEKAQLILEHKQALQDLEKQEALEQEKTITILAQDNKNFPFHQQKVKETQKALLEAQKKHDNATFFEQISGKKAQYLEDIETKRKSFEDAQNQFNELAKASEIQDFKDKHLANTSHKSLAELKEEAAQYTHEQKELANLKSEFEERTTTEKIIGAVTGKTKEQQAKIEELKEKTQSYEETKQQEEAKNQQIIFDVREKQSINDNRPKAQKPTPQEEQKPEEYTFVRDPPKVADDFKDVTKPEDKTLAEDKEAYRELWEDAARIAANEPKKTEQTQTRDTPNFESEEARELWEDLQEINDNNMHEKDELER